MNWKEQQRKAFLAAIRQNPGDAGPHMQYADWLDQNDEPEEADRQRAYPASEKWLREFAAGHTNGYDGEEEITFEVVVQAGYDWVERDDMFVQYGQESLRDDMDGEAQELFWKHWSVVTGVRPTEEQSSYGPFSCSC